VCGRLLALPRKAILAVGVVLMALLVLIWIAPLLPAMLRAFSRQAWTAASRVLGL